MTTAPPLLSPRVLSFFHLSVCLRSYIEQIKTADAAVEKARMEGKAMVEEVQTLLNKEKQAWATERSSLSSRLEEVRVILRRIYGQVCFRVFFFTRNDRRSIHHIRLRANPCKSSFSGVVVSPRRGLLSQHCARFVWPRIWAPPSNRTQYFGMDAHEVYASLPQAHRS